MAKEAFKSIHGNIFETPQWLFDTLNKEFNFNWDLACNADNIKCPLYFAEEEMNSLNESWYKCEGWLWLNPPYSPLKPWIVKTQEENKKGARIVVLCPPILSTRYFSQWLPSEIRFIVGRVPFLKDGIEMRSNTNDSCLLIYDTAVRQPKVTYVDRESLR